jgi:hypothetical protein
MSTTMPMIIGTPDVGMQDVGHIKGGTQCQGIVVSGLLPERLKEITTIIVDR